MTASFLSFLVSLFELSLLCHFYVTFVPTSDHVQFCCRSEVREGVEVRRLMDGRGRGLFTVGAVGAGKDLCWFEGEVVRKTVLGGVGVSELSYVLMVEPGLFLRAVQGRQMSPAWFANHTCVSPNARIVVVGCGLEARAVLRASRQIRAGEEVLVNYRLSGLDGGKLQAKHWQFECKCVHCSS
jgi:hypothetical protein